MLGFLNPNRPAGWLESISIRNCAGIAGNTHRGLQTVLGLCFSLVLVLIRLTSIDDNIKGLDSPSYSSLVYLNSDTVY